MNYLEFDFRIDNPIQGEMLLALLADSGFEAFEEEDGRLKAFIKEEAMVPESLEDILQTVPVMFTRTIIPQQNWNAKWESGFDPVIVNQFAAIRASFHQPVQQVKHEIIITPKMSFGTGHHATTFLVIEQMAHLDLTGKTVLDFGTGTGILAILAEKMGAAKITAIDNDEWSIENSIENVKANGCSKINIQKDDTIPAGEKYDLVIANINLNVILASLSAIAAVTERNAVILLSGFLKNDETILAETLLKNSCTLQSTAKRGEWICGKVHRN